MQSCLRLFKALRGFIVLACVVLTLQYEGSRLPVYAAKSDSPVLVELFTSEGCSSCPPADALLARLDATQFVPGAHAIVLSEHVTYWDRQGWRDPYSLDSMTRRQQQYAQRFKLDDVYTPQAVVDGMVQLVGNDERELQRDIVRGSSLPKQELIITEAQASHDAVQFSVRGTGQRKDTSVLMAALAEDAVQSSVTRGENAGRTLRHVAVVRVMQEFGSGVDDGRSLKMKLPEQLSKHDSKLSGHLRLVTFLADPQTGHVLGVDERTVENSK